MNRIPMDWGQHWHRPPPIQLSSPTPAPGAAVVPTSWGIQKVSCPIGCYRSILYAHFNKRQ